MPHEQITPRQEPLPTPRTPADTGWFADYTEVVTFGGILADVDALATVREVLEYFEKPWKWTSEYDAWARHGRPLDDEQPGWAAFLAEVSVQWGEG